MELQDPGVTGRFSAVEGFTRKCRPPKCDQQVVGDGESRGQRVLLQMSPLCQSTRLLVRMYYLGSCNSCKDSLLSSSRGGFENVRVSKIAKYLEKVTLEVGLFANSVTSSLVAYKYSALRICHLPLPFQDILTVNRPPFPTNATLLNSIYLNTLLNQLTQRLCTFPMVKPSRHLNPCCTRSSTSKNKNKLLRIGYICICVQDWRPT